MVLSSLFKFKSNTWLTSYCSAAGYNSHTMPKGLLQWRNSTEDNERALPLPEDTSLAQCKLLREQPTILWGALFFLPEMKPTADMIKSKNHNNLTHIKMGNILNKVHIINFSNYHMLENILNCRAVLPLKAISRVAQKLVS